MALRFRTVPAAALALLLMACSSICITRGAAAEKLHSKTFRSPGFRVGPGDVAYKSYEVGMPKGHVAIRSFSAEVVDENGTPIPLYVLYLHHFTLVRFHVLKHTDSAEDGRGGTRETRRKVPNSGLCDGLPQLFGVGSETRRTNSTLPPPYGIVLGDPKTIPAGYEEIWVLNIHAIDTRGAVDVRGCAECVCSLYNVTALEDGSPLPAGYEGGLHCCLDDSHCAVRPEFQQGSSSKRTLFLEYTVTWVDMSDEVIPVKVYILDVTERRTTIDDKDESHWCRIEYTVPKCAEGVSNCTHTAESVALLRDGGDVILAVAHQHLGGMGSTLHNEDGEEICSSFPIYGNGTEAANEDGYLVGMTTCLPEPGSVKVRAGEKLRLTSWYNNEEQHTGVMGLFHLLVADSQSTSLPPNFHTILILVAVTIVATFVFIGMTIVRHLRTTRGGTEYHLVG